MDAEKIIKSYNLWVDTDASNLAGQQYFINMTYET